MDLGSFNYTSLPHLGEHGFALRAGESNGKARLDSGYLRLRSLKASEPLSLVTANGRISLTSIPSYKRNSASDETVEEQACFIYILLCSISLPIDSLMLTSQWNQQHGLNFTCLSFCFMVYNL